MNTTFRMKATVVAVVLTVFGIPGIPAAFAAYTNVLVKNTASKPVAVVGSVKVSNRPTVYALQSGAWKTKVEGTPTVAIDPAFNGVAVSNTPNVSVVNEPTVRAEQSGIWGVSLLETATVRAVQSGQWGVTIANSPDVNIANEPTVNSRQQGTWGVNIDNRPTVDAAQHGAWSVSVANEPTVTISSSSGPLNVTNSVVNPLYVTSAVEKTPYNIVLGGVASSDYQEWKTTLPSDGKYLVIETMSTFNSGPAEVSFFIYDGPQLIGLYQPGIHYLSGDPMIRYGGTEACRIIVPAGCELTLASRLGKGSATNLTLAGYRSAQP